MKSEGLHCTEQMVSTLREREDPLCTDAAAEIEWLHEYIKKLERRIHNQRAANRTTWEIVDMRANCLGSQAARRSLIRHIKWLREAKAEVKMLRASA